VLQKKLDEKADSLIQRSFDEVAARWPNRRHPKPQCRIVTASSGKRMRDGLAIMPGPEITAAMAEYAPRQKNR